MKLLEHFAILLAIGLLAMLVFVELSPSAESAVQLCLGLSVAIAVGLIVYRSARKSRNER